jgi:hypothetical protein
MADDLLINEMKLKKTSQDIKIIGSKNDTGKKITRQTTRPSNRSKVLLENHLSLNK